MEKSKIKKAIEQSIKHWEKDILKPLLEGKQIYEGARCGTLLWKHSYKQVKLYSRSCALCKLFEEQCDNCPVYKNGYHCHREKSPWFQFRLDPTASNAKRMINALKYTLKDYK